MRHILSIISGTLCICSFSINSAETETARINEPLPNEIASEAAEGAYSIASTRKLSKKIKSSQSVFDQFAIPVHPPRSCQEATAKSIKDGTVTIDLSNTSDLTENGDAAITVVYDAITKTKASGTNSRNLALNLSKTNVTPDIVSKWVAIFKKDKRIVLLNLSENPNLEDSVIEGITEFQNIYLLNLSNTGITDAGVARIVSILETSGIGNLRSITLSGTKVSDQGIISLKAAMKSAVEKWKVSNQGKEYGMEGDGVIYKKRPVKSSKGKMKPVALPPVTTTPPLNNDVGSIENIGVEEETPEPRPIVASPESTEATVDFASADQLVEEKDSTSGIEDTQVEASPLISEINTESNSTTEVLNEANAVLSDTPELSTENTITPKTEDEMTIIE